MTSFDLILTQKMNRREFLVYLGLLFLTLSGIKGILNSLKKDFPKKSLTTIPKTSFGLGGYGGIKKGKG